MEQALGGVHDARALLLAPHDEHDAPVVRRRLTAPQELEMRALILAHTPDELGMPNGLWNKSAVRELITARIGIKLPDTTLGVYLRRWGFVPEKALRKAYSQQPALIRYWVKHRYPLIAAQAKAQHGEIRWWDESPLDQPAATRKGTERASASNSTSVMIAMTSNRRLVSWMVLDAPLTTRSLLEFFKRAIEENTRKVFLVVSNDPVHHSKPVASWLAAHADRLQLFELPSEEEASHHLANSRPDRPWKRNGTLPPDDRHS
ncbi:MAG TPA: winged helix-turn-helix domain-containing protein [Flavobacteriales bacterium]|nr:winged helix-turn-helix domain-containing protein [Flavobacteriales bacterium]